MQPVFVALAHIFADRHRHWLRKAQPLQRAPPEQKAGFKGFTRLVFHTLRAQLQRMFAVIGAHEQRTSGYSDWIRLTMWLVVDFRVRKWQTISALWMPAAS